MKTLTRLTKMARSLRDTVKSKADRRRYKGWRLERERRREI